MDGAFPPSYSAATAQHSSLSGELNFVDFLPTCLDPGGLFSKPVFEPYGVLIDRANVYLGTLQGWEAKTCESVEFKTTGNAISYEKMTYYEYGKGSTWYIRGLRLWLIPRLDQSLPPQRIGYVNVVPQKAHGEFETLNEVVERFDKSLATHPLPGRILTVETQEMKVSSFSRFDPERSLWVESGEHSNKFVFVIRVFYEIAIPANEVIGIASFVPTALQEAGFFSPPVFEPFSNVIGAAFRWCSQQQGIRFCNAQSVEIKMKSGYVIDTQRMSYTEHGQRRTDYIRILRLSYTKSLPRADGYMPSCPPVLNLTCKTFIPFQTTNSVFGVPDFESLSTTRNRIVAWVRATGARVVSAETSALRIFTGGEAYSGVEASFTYNRAEAGEYWIFVIRLYLDGFYAEPPPEVLPPAPVVEDQGCCVIL